MTDKERMNIVTEKKRLNHTQYKIFRKLSKTTNTQNSYKIITDFMMSAEKYTQRKRERETSQCATTIGTIFHYNKIFNVQCLTTETVTATTTTTMTGKYLYITESFNCSFSVIFCLFIDAVYKSIKNQGFESEHSNIKLNFSIVENGLETL